MARHDQVADALAVALDAVGGRWALLIVGVLLEQTGPMRFMELQRRLGRISSDVLTRRLRELVAADVVAPALTGPLLTVGAYALTERGRRLARVVGALSVWGAAGLPATSGQKGEAGSGAL